MPSRRPWIWFAVVVAYLGLVGVGLAWIIRRQGSTPTVPVVLLGVLIAGLGTTLVLIEVVQFRRLRGATATQKREAGQTRGGAWTGFGSLLAISGVPWLRNLGLVLAFGGVALMWWARPWVRPAIEPADGPSGG